MQNRRAGRAVLFLTPLFLFLIAETVTENLLTLSPAGILLNLAIYYLLYLGGFAVFGSTRVVYPAVNLLLFALAAGEYFVTGFRQRPIMIWDALALRTAITVSSNYRFAVTPRLAVAFLLTVALCVLAARRPYRLERGSNKGRKRLRAVGIWAASCVCFFAVLFGVLSPKLSLSVHMWDPIVNFEREGFLLSTVLSLRNLIPEKPAGYSAEAAREILDRLEAEAADGTLAETSEEAPVVESPSQAADGPAPVIPENVICIMNESFADLDLYNALRADTSFETDREVLPNFHGLEKNAEKGLLYVPVFGAMTPNTEYEFLTGNACALTPQGSVPFQFYTKPGDESLARTFSENGYRTVAMHPYPGYNWNRTEAYRNLGFEEFLDLAYYEDELGRERTLTKPRGYLSDRSDYEGIIDAVEKKAPGEKLFLFNVTMQNHGGYEVEDFEAQIRVTSVNGQECSGQYPKTEQYLTLMRMSDEALKFLLDYFEASDEPTAIVLFGDHQPSVETSFFEALYGQRWSLVPEEQKINSFRTPYLIWTNYDRTPEPQEDTSAFLLGNRVLKLAGIRPAGSRLQLEKVGEQFRAVHSMGVVEADGSFTGVDRMKSLDDYGEIHTLHILQYAGMFQK